MNQPSLVVLAAGMGSRYGGLKQIDPMGPNGETILDFSVFDAVRAGFGKVVFVIRRDFEAVFRDAIGGKFENRIAVEYAFQDLDDLPGSFEVPADRKKPWGTAHAVYAARHVVAEPFAMINADDFYGRDSYAALGAFLRGEQEKEDAVASCRLAMVGFQLANTLSEHGLERLIPEEPMRERLNDAIFDELCQGVFEEQTTELFLQAIRDLKAKGAECVILGCTEIPLIVTSTNSPLPTLDSTRLLARYAVREALNEDPITTKGGWLEVRPWGMK